MAALCKAMLFSYHICNSLGNEIELKSPVKLHSPDCARGMTEISPRGTFS